jgi:histidine triad (HIT) family protein
MTCIFCEIAAGKAKAEVVFESADAIAFLDRFPAARGHVVVIPKVHAATLPDLPDEAVGGFFRGVKAVVAKVAAALQPVGINVGWNHGEGAGQTVHHLHVHVLPRQRRGRGVQAMGEGADGAAAAEVAQAIRSA